MICILFPYMLNSPFKLNWRNTTTFSGHSNFLGNTCAVPICASAGFKPCTNDSPPSVHSFDSALAATAVRTSFGCQANITCWTFSFLAFLYSRFTFLFSQNHVFPPLRSEVLFSHFLMFFTGVQHIFFFLFASRCAKTFKNKVRIDWNLLTGAENPFCLLSKMKRTEPAHLNIFLVFGFEQRQIQSNSSFICVALFQVTDATQRFRLVCCFSSCNIWLKQHFRLFFNLNVFVWGKNRYICSSLLWSLSGSVKQYHRDKAL